MKIGIVGYGHVGKAMHQLFTGAVIYDKFLGIGCRNEINECDAVFICVPTPSCEDGSCNTIAVEEVIAWVKAQIIILRSTVPIGFTEKMCEIYKKDIVFQPEYYGETADHPYADLQARRWLTFGGTSKANNLAIKVYQEVINSNVRIYLSDSRTAEMAKYMENAYLALKVTFCNEIYDLASALDVDYNLLRELWLADPRMGSSHTFVYENNRGYGGSCLPKDIAALIHQAEEADIDVSLLKSVVSKNLSYKKITK